MIYTISDRYLENVSINESFFEKTTNEINLYIDNILEAAVADNKKKFDLGAFLKDLFKKIVNVLKKFANWLFADYITLFKEIKDNASYTIFLNRKQEYPMYENLLTNDILNSRLASTFSEFFNKKLENINKNRDKDKDFFVNYIQDMDTDFWKMVSKQFRTSIECSEDFNRYLKSVSQAKFVTCTGKEFEKMAKSKCNYAPDVNSLITEFSKSSNYIDNKYKDIINSADKSVVNEGIRGVIKYYREFADIVIKLAKEVYNCMAQISNLYNYAITGKKLKWEQNSSAILPDINDNSRLYKSVFDDIVLI